MGCETARQTLGFPGNHTVLFPIRSFRPKNTAVMQLSHTTFYRATCCPVPSNLWLDQYTPPKLPFQHRKLNQFWPVRFPRHLLQNPLLFSDRRCSEQLSSFPETRRRLRYQLQPIRPMEPLWPAASPSGAEERRSVAGEEQRFLPW